MWLCPAPVHSTPVTCYSLLLARNKLNPDKPHRASSLWSSHSEHRNYITLASQPFPPHLQTFLVANSNSSKSCSLTHSVCFRIVCNLRKKIPNLLTSVQLDKEDHKIIRLKKEHFYFWLVLIIDITGFVLWDEGDSCDDSKRWNIPRCFYFWKYFLPTLTFPGEK